MVDSKKNDDWMEELEKTANSAPFQQLFLGSASGCVSGFVSGKIGIVQAAVLGGALFVVHVTYTEGGFSRSKFDRQVKSARDKFDDKLSKLGKQFENETGIKVTDTPTERVEKFFKKNIIFVGAFAGCFILGRAMAMAE